MTKSKNKFSKKKPKSKPKEEDLSEHEDGQASATNACRSSSETGLSNKPVEVEDTNDQNHTSNANIKNEIVNYDDPASIQHTPTDALLLSSKAIDHKINPLLDPNKHLSSSNKKKHHETQPNLVAIPQFPWQQLPSFFTQEQQLSTFVAERLQQDPTPAEMQILGKDLTNGVIPIGVFGNGNALDFGTTLDHIAYLKGSQRPSMSEINQRVIQLRRKICRKGDAVKVPEITLELCKYYNVSNVCQLNPIDSRPIRKETDVSEILEIVRLQAKVNAFIQAFITFRNISTLHELEIDLCKLQNKESFNDFFLGPLEKQSLIYQYFTFPCKKKIPIIKTMDVFKALWEFSKKKRKNQVKRDYDEKLSLEEFLEYFNENHGFNNPFETGVRIQSFPLAVKVVFKAGHSDSRDVREAIILFEKHITQNLHVYLENSAKKLVGEEGSLIARIQSMDIYQGLTLMCSMIDMIKKGYKGLAKGEKKTLFTCCNNIQVFLNIVKNDRFVSQVFQLLLSISKLIMVDMNQIEILKKLGFEGAAVQIIENEVNRRRSESKQNAITPKRKLYSKIKSCPALKKTLEFKTLLIIENWVVNEFNDEGITSFEEFGHGCFLKFVNSDKELKSKFEEQLQSQSGFLGQATTSVSKQEIQAFIEQCPKTSSENLYNAIRLQFGIDSSTKAIEQIVKSTNNSIASQENNPKSPMGFIYLNTLTCGDEMQQTDNGNSRDDSFSSNNEYTKLAKTKIRLCPDLTDISEWSNWNTMYEWKLGPLKTFLQKMIRDELEMSKDSWFLHLKNNIFFKVSKKKTTDTFGNGLKHLNCQETCESLVAIFCSNGSIQESPLALLSNYAETAFLEFTKDIQVTDEDPRESPLLQFSLECFKTLPFDLLLCVVQKLFLNPLAKIYGVLEVPRLLLLASTNSSAVVSKPAITRTRKVLHCLGYRLSIIEWIDDYDELLKEMLVVQETKKKNDEEEGELLEPPINVPPAPSAQNDVNDESVSISEEEVHNDGIGEVKLSRDENVEKADNDVSMTFDEEENRKQGKQLRDEGSVSKPDDVSNLVDNLITNPDARFAYCKNVIEDIRKNQFAIGCEEQMSERGKEALEVYREREGRSLDRLSKELYSKDSHFVLELIQNADDNEYFDENMKKDAVEKPTVAFIVEKDKVIVLNNEKGFADKNIKALCDVGKSTKGMHRKGYIGQKGIGFKSVFRVTQAPEIHSNGFHIKFDVTKGKSGYIVPEWIEEEYQQNSLSVSEENEKFCWRTEIILPLKEEMQMEKLTSRFHDIDPSLLMFLNRLHTIIIDDRVTGTVKTMSKEIVGKNLIELRENDKTSLWFVVDKDVPINVRPDVSSTSIAVAFPITSTATTKTPSTSNNVLRPQKVFAFLPLRSYGFKYVIQADFEVPSSREDIDKDSAWNQYILKEIPALILQAFHLFKNHPHFSGLDGITEFFKFIDLEEHVLGVFKRVQSNVLKKLQQERCIPILRSNNNIPLPSVGTENNIEEIATDYQEATTVDNQEETTVDNQEETTVDNQEETAIDYPEETTVDNQEETMKSVDDENLPISEFEFALPSSVVSVIKSEHRIVVTPEMLKTYLNLNYIHVAFQNNKHFSSAIFKALGVMSLSKDQLVEVLKARIAGTDYSNEESVDALQLWIGKWLAVIATALQQECDLTDCTRDQIQSLKMVPLSDNSLVALKENIVFFPVDNLVNSNASSAEKIIEKDLCTLSRNLMSGLDEIEKQQVKRLLKDLGVKLMTPNELINEHIIPCFKDEKKWKEKKEKTLVAYVKYMHEQYLKNSNIFDIDEIKNDIALKTNRGFAQPMETSIYYTKEYGNKLELERRLSGCNWCLISNDYIGNKPTEMSQRKWKEFFGNFGLNHFTSLRQETKELHRSDLVQSPWATYSETWEQTKDDTYVIHDLVCPEFTTLLQSRDFDQLKKFAQVLDNEWTTQGFEKYDIINAKCKVTNTDGKALSTTISSFFYELRHSEWLKTSNGSKACAPYGLYKNLACIRDYLGDKVDYLELGLKNEDFERTLGVRVTLEFSEFLKEFKTWRLENTFETTWGHVFKIYFYLRGEISRSRDESLRDDLLENPLVFLPPAYGPLPAQYVTGKFYKVDEVCWEDSSGLLMAEADVGGVSQRRILSSIYQPMGLSIRDFFIKEMGVDRYPRVKEYLTVLKRIVEKTNLPDIDAYRKILQLFGVLGSRCIVKEMKNELSKDYQYGKSHDENLYFYGDLNTCLDPVQCKLIKEAVQKIGDIFPTSMNAFTGIAEENAIPVLVFNDSLSTVYESSNESNVCFIKIANIVKILEKSTEQRYRVVRRRFDDDILKIVTFFKACGLKTLTELVESEIVPTQIVRGCYVWESCLHEAVPYIQRYISVKQPELYNRLKQRNFIDYLRQSVFFVTHTFDVIHRLKGRNDVNIVQQKVAYVEDAENKALIYVKQDNVDDIDKKDDILRALMDLFVDNNDEEIKDDLSDFVVSLFIETKKEAFMEKRKRIGKLATGEEEWTFPKPHQEFYQPPIEYEEDNDDSPLPKSSANNNVNDNDGERLMTCWPPRQPGSNGFVSKPESVRQQEEAVLAKWQLPEAPPNNQVTGVDSSVEPPPQFVSRGTEASSTVSPRTKDNGIVSPTTNNDGILSPRNNQGNTAQNSLSINGRIPEQQRQQQVSTSPAPNQSTISQQNAVIPDTVAFNANAPKHSSDSHRSSCPSRPSQNGSSPQKSDSGVDLQKSESEISTVETNGSKKGPLIIENLPSYNLVDVYQNIQFQIGKGLKQRILNFNNTELKALGDNMKITSFNEVIGKMGEEIVYNYFRSKYEKEIKSEIMRIHWLNEEIERGEPYDLVITRLVRSSDCAEENCGSNPDRNSSSEYVEVKTTLQNEEKQFEISSQQLKFAFEHGSNFHLYRVSGLANQTEPKLRFLKNLSDYMDNKAVKLYMVL